MNQVTLKITSNTCKATVHFEGNVFTEVWENNSDFWNRTVKSWEKEDLPYDLFKALWKLSGLYELSNVLKTFENEK